MHIYILLQFSNIQQKKNYDDDEFTYSYFFPKEHFLVLVFSSPPWVPPPGLLFSG